MVDTIEHIYIHRYNHFLSVAYHIVENRELAKDVLQDAFLGILNSNVNFESVPHAERYLNSCIKNAAFKRLSRERRQRAMICDFLESDRPNLNWIHRLINKLACCTCRTIIKERYLGGQTHREIATRHEVSHNYVINKEKEALKILKKYMVEN